MAATIQVCLSLSAGAWAQTVKTGPELYQLGPDDVVTVNVMDVDELTNKTFRLNMRGDVNIPLVGTFHAGGLTPEQLQAQLTERLRTYVQAPDVSVTVSDYHSQPVSILGSVAAPGVHQLQGNKNLLQMLSLAGGLRPDASNTIKITRRKEWGTIPLPTAKDDQTGKFSVAEVNAQALLDASDPAENIAIKPYDVISVPKSDVIYVVGEVGRAGGFMLNDNRANISVLKALALAGGLSKTAASKSAKLLRQAPGGAERKEIPLDLKAMLEGKTPDFALQKEDILFVPSSARKVATKTAIEAMVSVGSGLAIIAIPRL